MRPKRRSLVVIIVTYVEPSERLRGIIHQMVVPIGGREIESQRCDLLNKKKKKKTLLARVGNVSFFLFPIGRVGLFSQRDDLFDN